MSQDATVNNKRIAKNTGGTYQSLAIPNMESPKFSICIPAYKARFLKEAVDSCLAQTYNNYEVIVVDDCSPENLGEIMAVYKDNSRIRYYRNEQNCGAVNVVDNWNICLGYCTGDYVICMGDDDRLLPCCLEEYVNIIETHPGLGVYHAWTEIIDEKGDFIGMQAPRPELEGVFGLLWNRWNGRNKQYIGDFCYDVAKLKEDGGFFFLPMAWASDDITAVRAARYNGIANTQRICFQYRKHSLTISSSGSSDVKMEASLKEKEWYENFIKNEVKGEIENKYKTLVQQSIHQHFRHKMKGEITKDLGRGIYRVFHWLKVGRKYGFSSLSIIDAFNDAVRRKFYERWRTCKV